MAHGYPVYRLVHASSFGETALRKNVDVTIRPHGSAVYDGGMPSRDQRGERDIKGVQESEDAWPGCVSGAEQRDWLRIALKQL